MAKTVFDGTRFIDDAAVLVEGAEIVRVGESEELRALADEVIDLDSSTLLPGFIDLHVHTGVFGDYKALVTKGVTTARDLGINEGVLPFPDSAPLEVIAAGPIITAPGGYPISVGLEGVAAPVDGAAEARRKVNELAAKDVGVIKIAITDNDGRWPSLSRADVRAIVDEAHRVDLSVTAHVVDRRDVEIALAGGVDELAHIPCSGRLTESFWRTVVDAGIPIVGTLHVRSSFCDVVTKRASNFVAAGGALLYGSDMGNTGIPFGIDVTELEMMMEAGLDLEQALAGATSKAGELLGRSPLGEIVEDAPADLIAIRGDLRDDVSSLEDPVFVMADGEVVRSP